MDIQVRSIASITPYDNNPRNNDDAVDAVAASLQEYGWRQPIVVDQAGIIVVGHTRYKAALKLGMTEVPVHVATGLTPAQLQAYRLADNKSSDLSDWNYELLTVELGSLQEQNYDLGQLGFTADELQRLVKSATEEMTDLGTVPPVADTAVTQPGDLWVLGRHRLLCGDSSSRSVLERLLDGKRVHLVNTDPPYNVKVEPRSNNAIAAGLSSFEAPTHHQKMDVARHPKKAKATHKKLRAKDRPLANDFVSDEAFDQLLDAWFGNIAFALEPGRGFYIWGGYANVANYPAPLQRHGLYFSQAIIWDKMHPVLTRKDYMGAHEWCQPPDTQVMTTEGTVPLASLRTGDRVIGYSRPHQSLVGLREGLEVQCTSRPYSDDLVGVHVDQSTSWSTKGHLWTARLAPQADQYWCVYLMKRGNWWRVGKSKLLSSWGFGVKHRLATERGEQAWILSVHQSNVEAMIAEQLIMVNYGIPTTIWETHQPTNKTDTDIRRLYERLDLPSLQIQARRCLQDHGKSEEYPFVSKPSTAEKISRRVSFGIRTCNLFSEVFQIPLPGRGQRTHWMTIRSVIRDRYDGLVYSMNVPKYHHYIADGMVTHNCFYGWKEGAAHQYYGPNNATDLWHLKKVNPQSMVHLTEKPVELAARAIEYSSQVDEHVLDLFGGSGSTLIACQQLQRSAFLMELDPLYCDVIVRRFMQTTGQAAQCLDADGQTTTRADDLASTKTE